jgi:hypothetical protein
VGFAALDECLFEGSGPTTKTTTFSGIQAGSKVPTFIEILRFTPANGSSPDFETFSPSSALSPAIALHIKQLESDSQHPSQNVSKFELLVEIGHSCTIQLDCSLVDRLYHVLNKSPKKSPKSNSDFSQFMSSTTDILSASQRWITGLGGRWKITMEK